MLTESGRPGTGDWARGMSQRSIWWSQGRSHPSTQGNGRHRKERGPFGESRLIIGTGTSHPCRQHCWDEPLYSGRSLPPKTKAPFCVLCAQARPHTHGLFFLGSG